MKIIDKMQQGGGMPSFVSYTNVPQPQPAAPYAPQESTPTQSKSDNEGGIGLLDKNMVKMLYENGLPSDVAKFVDSSDLFGNAAMANPFERSSETNKYKMLLRMLPKIKVENDRFKDALTEVRKNNGLGEVAVTTSGYVLTLDEKGNFAKKHLQSVDLSKERLLTNSELADYRANNPEAAFQSDITSIIANGVGLDKINEYIQTITDKIGSSTVDRDGYVSRKGNQITQGMELLKTIASSEQDLAGMTMDGVYKASGLSKNQALQAQQALTYILSTMPTNMKTVLQARAKVMGEDDKIGLQKLVMQLVGSSLEDSHTFKLDFQENVNPDGTKKTTKSDDNVLDVAKAIATGKGPTKDATINPGSTYSLKLYGNWYPTKDANDKPLGRSTFTDVTSSVLAGVLDFQSATMDNKLLNPMQMDRIVQDGSGMVTVDLPIDEEAAAHGIMQPDITKLQSVETAEQEIKEQGLTKPNDIDAVYQKHGLPSKYNRDGTTNLGRYKRFAVFNAYADERAFSEDPDMSDMVSKVKDKNMIEAVSRLLQGTDKKYKAEDIYEGSVYVPVRSSVIAASMGTGNYATVQGNDANMLQALDQNKEKEQTYQPFNLMRTKN